MTTDRDAIEELRSLSDANVSHFVQHYLYFPQEQASKGVAAILVERGFEVEHRLGADNINWLVLAKSRIVPAESKIAELREQMEKIAAEYSGEYDGWEAEITSS